MSLTKEATLAVPRDRAGTFDPQLIANISGDFAHEPRLLFGRGLRLRHRCIALFLYPYGEARGPAND
jgi:hypothetical protein